MSPTTTMLETEVPRVLGSHSAGRPGPLLVVVAGIHGNEPAGVTAVRRVLRDLGGARPPLRGRVVGIAGNRAALARGVRFLDRDLNRMWTAAELESLQGSDPAADTAERAELREFLAAVEREAAAADGEVLFLDLHSTSGDGPPFAILSGGDGNRRMARALRVPSIFGLESGVRGTFSEHFASRGHVAIVLEGGRNDHPSTADHHESAVWLALEASGLLPAGAAELEPHRERLARASAGLPPAAQVRMRYAIEPGEDFRMEPGWRNFHPVARGTLLARSDRRGELRAPFDGILLLPRYQGQGDDGFFLAAALP